MSKTNSRKAKSSARTKKNTKGKKSTRKKHPDVWGVFINASYVGEPTKVSWDDQLECYCTEMDTFKPPHGFVFKKFTDANFFAQGGKMVRFHIGRMISMGELPEEEDDMDEDAIYEEELYESQK